MVVAVLPEPRPFENMDFKLPIGRANQKARVDYIETRLINTSYVTPQLHQGLLCL